eukprot:g503.t1
MRVFLEFAVGDLEKFSGDYGGWTRWQVAKRKCDEKAYKQFADFVSRRGAVFGAGADADALDDEAREMLAEIFKGEQTESEVAGAPRAFVFKKPASPTVGRLVFELFDAECPKTCENFRALCTGEKGTGKGHGKPLHFLRSAMHRVVPGAFLHGGDFTRFDGSGGDSIYGGKFNDEKPGLKRKHDAKGLLSMANSGKNSNTSQFFVTLAGGTGSSCAKLDGKHVVFGKCVEGLELLDKVVELCKPDVKKEAPTEKITIVGCGELK